jgi:histidyl-tRNA synthetase
LKFISDLRSAAIAVDYSLGNVKPDKQFKRAQELKVAQTVKLEKAESGDFQVRIRDMRTREEQRVSVDEALAHLASRYGHKA